MADGSIGGFTKDRFAAVRERLRRANFASAIRN